MHSREQAFTDPWYQALIIRGTHHTICLSWTGLSIGKNAGIVAFKSCFKDICTKIFENLTAENKYFYWYQRLYKRCQNKLYWLSINFVNYYSHKVNDKTKTPRITMKRKRFLWQTDLGNSSLEVFCIAYHNEHIIISLLTRTTESFHRELKLPARGGRNRGVNLPSPYFLSQFLPPPYFLFPHPGPSSSILPTTNFSFSPSSLIFPLISPSSQLFLGHFSLLPILFLPPPATRQVQREVIGGWAIDSGKRPEQHAFSNPGWTLLLENLHMRANG